MNVSKKYDPIEDDFFERDKREYEEWAKQEAIREAEREKKRPLREKRKITQRIRYHYFKLYRNARVEYHGERWTIEAINQD